MKTEQEIFEYVSGQADEKLRTEIALWAEQNPENRKQIIEARKLYMASLLNYPLDSEREQVKNKKRPMRRIAPYAYGAFAAIALFLTLTYCFNLNPGKANVFSAQSFSVPNGQRAKVLLSDSTLVWINSNSTINFVENKEGIRLVELTGEALFQVSKDEKHPFVVKTGSREIRVLGTKFNVNSYDDDDFSLKLYEGQVEFVDKESKQSAVLNPNQKIEVREDGTYVKRQLDEEESCRWIDGYFSFNDASFYEILNQICNSLSIKVIFENPRTSAYRCSCTFDSDENISHFLSVLNEVHRFEYSWSEDRTTLYIR